MTSARVDDEFTTAVHVYEPHRQGLPRLRPYLRELWHRRQFVVELSRTNMRAAHTNTVFGQAWLVINPLLLAAVYFILVQIISGGGQDKEFFVHLVGGLFAFTFLAGALTTSASSIVGGGRLLMNMSFPKLMLPLSASRTAFFKFLPTLVVYFIIRFAFGLSLDWEMLLAGYFLFMLILFAAGTGMFFAAVQVYFRDVTSFLPYFLRIWLYLSPVLWYPSDLEGSRFERFAMLMELNPLFSLIGGWSDAIVAGVVPPLSLWLGSAAWGIGALIVGALFFMSREREFVVRL
jgi:ABC-type polysaccharide/polyol phosphate export permease